MTGPQRHGNTPMRDLSNSRLKPTLMVPVGKTKEKHSRDEQELRHVLFFYSKHIHPDGRRQRTHQSMLTGNTSTLSCHIPQYKSEDKVLLMAHRQPKRKEGLDSGLDNLAYIWSEPSQDKHQRQLSIQRLRYK